MTERGWILALTATLTEVSYADLEESLCRLPGVEAVRVIGRNGSPAEIHVLATPGKPPKQIVRDVQSLALAAFGISVDRRIVSVVQIEGDELSRGDRPVVLDIAQLSEGDKVTITVTLSWHQQLYAGEASGPAAAATKLRLVAEAALSALAKALNDQVALAIAAVDTPTVGGRQVAIAQVVMVAEGEEKMVVGSALVGPDPAQAVVRAVLDALNRQVPELRR